MISMVSGALYICLLRKSVFRKEKLNSYYVSKVSFEKNLEKRTELNLDQLVRISSTPPERIVV